MSTESDSDAPSEKSFGGRGDDRADASIHETVEEGIDTADERWPIGFIVTVTMTALYVGYRVVQLTIKLFQWLF